MTNLEITRRVRRGGCYYAPDPSSQVVCSIGGNIAENSGGAHCLKYGFTVHHVLGVEAVLPDGELVHLGGAALDRARARSARRRSSDPKGTLAVVTKATLRLLRRPEAVLTLLAGFDSIDEAGEAVSAIIGGGIVPAAVEMMDRLTIDAAEAAVHPGFPKTDAVLIVELDGPTVEVDELFAIVEAICRRAGAATIEIARDAAARERIWKGRKAAFAAMGRVSPNYYVQDGVVPRTRLPEVLRRIRELEARSGLRIGNVFHAGDGNLHPLICYDESIPGQAEHAEKVASEILSYCIEAGGAITGEHGVGADKKAYMPKMFTPDDLDDDAAAALRVRSVRHLQSGQGVPHAAAVRRSAGPVPPASGRAGGPRGAILIRPIAGRSRRRRMSPALAALLAAVPTGARTARSSQRRRHEIAAWWAGRGRERRPCLSTTALAPVHRPLRGRSDGDGCGRHDAGRGQRGAGPAGQWLPLDPPAADRATIGGIVAANDSGPRRHKHGAPRDLIIGVEMVLRRRTHRARRAAKSSRMSPATISRGCSAARSVRLARHRQRDIQAGAAGRRSRGPWSRRFANAARRRRPGARRGCGADCAFRHRDRVAAASRPHPLRVDRACRRRAGRRGGIAVHGPGCAGRRRCRRRRTVVVARVRPERLGRSGRRDRGEGERPANGSR